MLGGKPAEGEPAQAQPARSSPASAASALPPVVDEYDYPF
jgi:hypothetical protein